MLNSPKEAQTPKEAVQEILSDVVRADISFQKLRNYCWKHNHRPTLPECMPFMKTCMQMGKFRVAQDTYKFITGSDMPENMATRGMENFRRYLNDLMASELK